MGTDFQLDYNNTSGLHKHINQVSELNNTTIASNTSPLKEDVNIVDMETFFITGAHPDLTWTSKEHD